MRTIVLKNKTQTTCHTIYLTIAKHWLRVDEEFAILEDGYWDEYPVEELAEIKTRNNLKYATDPVAEVVKLGIFDSKINDKLLSYKLSEVVKGGYKFFLQL